MKFESKNSFSIIFSTLGHCKTLLMNCADEFTSGIEEPAKYMRLHDKSCSVITICHFT